MQVGNAQNSDRKDAEHDRKGRIDPNPEHNDQTADNSNPQDLAQFYGADD